VLDIDQDRLVEMMEEQATIGATDEGGLHRLALSEADRKVRDWFCDQLERIGLTVRVDEMGNIFGRREGTDPTASPLLLGSHLDSQPNGGIYDGPLGICAAIEFVRTLEAEDIETRRPIEVVNWTNEEGSRFQPPMQGSGVWAGIHDLEIEYEKTDGKGNTFIDELERIDYHGPDSCEPDGEYAAYLELHIEQGPSLEESDSQIGVVTGIVGQTWGTATYQGEANHTGPTAMHHRRDALVPAAEVITKLRQLPTTLGERTVGTTGYIEVQPNSANVIPETVTFTWDIRDPSDEVVERAYQRIAEEIQWAAKRENVTWESEEQARVSSVVFADHCVETVQAAADKLDYRSERLISGAGHDASHVATVCDTGMVFAVSEEGTSHSPNEQTSWTDCYRATNTFATAALRFAGNDA
jgi:N-carbamoyl-L-amino-acid hydrolase